MDSLNESQREAVTATDGPILVVAGAGSGKTWTLACRVAHLLERGVPPERILLLTFTRRAAREMLARADRLVGGSRTGNVWGGTFHAVGNRLLRLYGRPFGIQPDFTVLDQSDTADLINLIRDELGLGRSTRRFPRKETLAAIYSRTVNAGTKLGDVLDKHFPWCRKDAEGIRAIFERYTQRKRDQNVLDYDDLLLYWSALAGSSSGEELSRQFEHILVDEYQDTNPLQAQILLRMRRSSSNIMVVGDDAQAIYSFRAATVRNILDFPRQFPGTRIVKLERNYRSTKPILDVSNAVIAESSERHEKTLWTKRADGPRPTLATSANEAEQSDRVCRLVLEHRERGTPLRQQAVLFRASHHSDLLELELTRRNIPYVKYGGLKFLEAAHVKDVLSLLRILENPHDEVSWFRVLQLVEGIGPATARRVMDAVGVRRQPSGGAEARTETASPLRRLLDGAAPVPSAARPAFEELRSALSDCLGGDSAGLTPAAEIGRLRAFFEPVFERLYNSAQSRLRDVEQLEQIAASYTSRGRFISELTLDPPSSTADLAGPPLLDEDFLILSTIHSAKGGEWDVVHVIHAADGMIPSDMSTGDPESVEEERRLFYVSLTRARNALYVHFPLRYYHRPRGTADAHTYAQLTRFVSDPVRALFDRDGTWPEATSRTAVGTGAGVREVDAFLNSLWS